MENIKAALYMRLARPRCVALYCRVAQEDSDAIEWQEMMLLDFAKVNGYEACEVNIHRVYCDNGASGLTFDRPGMNKLMADIRDGRVDIVIVKDASRVARDYVKFREWLRVLRKHNVRLVTVHDG